MNCTCVVWPPCKDPQWCRPPPAIVATADTCLALAHHYRRPWETP